MVAACCALLHRFSSPNDFLKVARRCSEYEKQAHYCCFNFSLVGGQWHPRAGGGGGAGGASEGRTKPGERLRLKNWIYILLCPEEHQETHTKQVLVFQKFCFYNVLKERRVDYYWGGLLFFFFFLLLLNSFEAEDALRGGEAHRGIFPKRISLF